MTDVTASGLADALRDRYTLEREIGRGGMATVWLAHDLKHDRKVALKVLHPDLGAALGPERFLHEIKAAAGLHHPHILQLHDSGDAEGALYYVMPYVDGESLRDRLRRNGPLGLSEGLGSLVRWPTRWTALSAMGLFTETSSLKTSCSLMAMRM